MTRNSSPSGSASSFASRLLIIHHFKKQEGSYEQSVSLGFLHLDHLQLTYVGLHVWQMGPELYKLGRSPRLRNATLFMFQKVQILYLDLQTNLQYEVPHLDINVACT